MTRQHSGRQTPDIGEQAITGMVAMADLGHWWMYSHPDLAAATLNGHMVIVR